MSLHSTQRAGSFKDKHGLSQPLGWPRSCPNSWLRRARKKEQRLRAHVIEPGLPQGTTTTGCGHKTTPDGSVSISERWIETKPSQGTTALTGGAAEGCESHRAGTPHPQVAPLQNSGRCSHQPLRLLLMCLVLHHQKCGFEGTVRSSAEECHAPRQTQEMPAPCQPATVQAT